MMLSPLLHAQQDDPCELVPSNSAFAEHTCTLMSDEMTFIQQIGPQLSDHSLALEELS